jgi:alpha-tubulin suppressor-like RCC1 family protein
VDDRRSVVPVEVTGITSAVDISLGASHACAVLNDGSVVCWGADDQGQLGDGRKTLDQRRAIAVVGVGKIRAVAAGERFSCAVATDGSVWCWGTGAEDPSLDSPDAAPQLPKRMANVTGAIGIAVAPTHACALMKDGSIRCWGNTQLALGFDDFSQSVPPTAVEGIAGATAVSGNSRHMCALLGQAVWCWGAGERGDLGTGDSPPISKPRPAIVPPSIKVFAGLGGSCSITTTHEVYCWGNDLDSLTSSFHATPAAVPALAGATDVSFLSGQACASIGPSGEVRCVGRYPY